MRSRIIVLLAVCSNGAVAGIIRHSAARAQHQNAARYLNHTDTSSIPADVQTLTPVSIPSSSMTPSIASSPATSIFPAATSSTTSTTTPSTPKVASSSNPAAAAANVLSASPLNEFLSGSATLPTVTSTAAVSEHSEARSVPIATSSEATVTQPTETLSRLFNVVGSPSNSMQPSANAPKLSSTSPASSAATLSINPNIPSTTNIQVATYTSSSSSGAYYAPSSIAIPFSTSSAAGAGQAVSRYTTNVPTLSSVTANQALSPVVLPVPISSGSVQVLGTGGDTADEFSPVSLDSSLPAPTGTAQYPTAKGDNTVTANAFNSVYQTLNEDSPCNPSVPSQAYVCVDGEIAECQSDATYVLKSCPRGQSCYALPKPSGSTGVVVQCAVPSDAHSILAPSSSIAVPVTASSQTALLSQAEGDVAQATQVVSVQRSAQAATSSLSAQERFESQAVTPTQPVLAAIATPLEAQSPNRLDKSALPTSTSSTPVQSSFQVPSQVLDPSVPAVTATAPQNPDSSSLDSSPKATTSPPVPSTTAAILSVPKALFEVVTAPESDQASSSAKSKQATTPVIQSSTISQLADPTSHILTEADTPTTSTSSAAVAGITPVPTGVLVNEKVAVGNGQATVTVTVTVTTTETPAPVTIHGS